MFYYSSRQNTSLAISKVRVCLMQKFVPKFLGLGCMGKDAFIRDHVTDFSNELYNGGI
jgi:hypothetical protein